MDYKIPLAIVLMVGAVLGLMARGPAPVPGQTPAPHMVQAAMAASAARPSNVAGAGWGQPVTLDRDPDGHFYADVSIDGQSYHMLVDTGASMVALSGDDARRMGLQWDPNDLRPIVQGAGGPVDAVATTIPRMALGGIEVTNVPAVIIPKSSGISLLGQAFLSQVGDVQIKDNQMLLGS